MPDIADCPSRTAVRRSGRCRRSIVGAFMVAIMPSCEKQGVANIAKTRKRVRRLAAPHWNASALPGPVQTGIGMDPAAASPAAVVETDPALAEALDETAQ